MDNRIEFGTFAVGGRNNKRAGRTLGVVLGDSFEAFALIRDLDHLASADQCDHCSGRIAGCYVLDVLLKVFIVLSDVLSQCGGGHAVLLKLLERAACFDGLMLAHVTDEKHLIFGDVRQRSEEHTSELQSHVNLVCRLLLEKKNSESMRTV